MTFLQRVLELRAGRGLWEGCRTQTIHGLTLMEGLCLSSPQVLVLGSPRLLQAVAPEGHDLDSESCLPRTVSSKDFLTSCEQRGRQNKEDRIVPTSVPMRV